MPVPGETDSYLKLIQICGNALATGEWQSALRTLAETNVRGTTFVVPPCVRKELIYGF